MTDKRLEQFALDWHRVTAAWIKTLEAEMEAAFDADDGPRYRRAGLLKGEIESARRVMLDSAGMGLAQAAEAVN